ncbi:peptidoglycan-binding domain-containing protein [Patulibacter defluvii]|uniref:peptidoglycan-binding domain-containing protein n=1 Tax=Patulibacter defluvii TaxID=3095358 RepID=UPI002A753CE1|nr:peptidoglycan-binding domain-containing protein [Patulibacter sp. DM4]
MSALTAPVTAAPAPAHGAPQQRPGLRLREIARLLLVPDAAAAVTPAAQARDVQELLVRAGYLGPAGITGRWRPVTVDAVRRFQREHGLPEDGVAGAATVDLLLEVVALRD